MALRFSPLGAVKSFQILLFGVRVDAHRGRNSASPITKGKDMANQPTHDLKIISGEGDKAKFTTVAAVWPTKDRKSFAGEIPAGISVSGRFVLSPRKGTDEAAG